MNVRTFPRALAALAVSLGLACSRGGGAQQGGGPRAVPVRATAAVEKDVPVELRAVGRIEANQSVAIRAQVGGVIVAVHFREGQQVKKGDLLIELDRRPYEAALAEAKARLAQDRARSENARADAKRLETLVAKEYVTQQEFEAARANALSLESQVVADEAAVERAALNLAYASMRAPLAGKTGRLHVDVGNLIAANSAEPLVTIEQVRPVFAAFSVPERHLGAVRGQTGDLPVRIRSQGNEEIAGTLAFVDNVVDAATGTILLKARIPNDDERLWPGQVVDVFLRIAERSRAVVVPASAVASGQQGDYAYVVTPEKKAQLRLVVVDHAGEAEVVIGKGIVAGETVVTEGLLKLRPDVPVEILEDEPAAATPAAAKAGPG